MAGFTPTHSANVTVLHDAVVGASRNGGLPDVSLYRPAAHAAALKLLGTWVADARFVARRARERSAGLHLRPGVIYVGHSFGGATPRARRTAGTWPRLAP
ncbi:MAG: alpha/beta hydrolase [Marmoricola sp.]|nr:alpha/beta hydrolase [Marmoricola sp.]